MFGGIRLNLTHGYKQKKESVHYSLIWNITTVFLIWVAEKNIGDAIGCLLYTSVILVHFLNNCDLKSFSSVFLVWNKNKYASLVGIIGDLKIIYSV